MLRHVRREARARLDKVMRRESEKRRVAEVGEHKLEERERRRGETCGYQVFHVVGRIAARFVVWRGDVVQPFVVARRPRRRDGAPVRVLHVRNVLQKRAKLQWLTQRIHKRYHP